MPETSAATVPVPALGRLRAASVVPKPWGRELWYEQNGSTAQILEIHQGQALTLQAQKDMTETLFLLSGRVWFHLNGHNFEIIPGAFLPIVHGDVCGLHAIENAVVLITRRETQGELTP